jgi:hypothetical protein
MCLPLATSLMKVALKVISQSILWIRNVPFIFFSLPQLEEMKTKRRGVKQRVLCCSHRKD